MPFPPYVWEAARNYFELAGNQPQVEDVFEFEHKARWTGISGDVIARFVFGAEDYHTVYPEAEKVFPSRLKRLMREVLMDNPDPLGRGGFSRLSAEEREQAVMEQLEYQAEYYRTGYPEAEKVFSSRVKRLMREHLRALPDSDFNFLSPEEQEQEVLSMLEFEAECANFGAPVEVM